MQYSTSFVLFAALVFSVQAEDQLSITRRVQMFEKCKKDLSPSLDTLSIVATRNIPQTEAQRCLLECIYTNLNIFKDGKLNRDDPVILSQFKNDPAKLEKLKKLSAECATYVVAEPGVKCSLAKKLRECVFSKPQYAEFQLFKKEYLAGAVGSVGSILG